jgi:molybdopterin/thiamine biosynthesis adenylyltransferase
MGKKIKFVKPIILPPEEVDTFRAKNNITETIDIYNLQVTELAAINNPGEKSSSNPKNVEEVYIYYPWTNQLVRSVGEEDLFKLRTNRNKNLITEQEQDKLSAFTVGAVGMSVGSGIAMALAYSGISKKIKIADNDTLETANLNRLRESLANVGQSKVQLAARHIYELDPFSEVELFEEGVNESNIEQFFAEPKLDLVVDEIDDFKMKVRLRLHAKKHGVPLVMFTSLGDNILVDVERFDLDQNVPIFHGILTDVSEEILANPDITLQDIQKYSVQLVGQQYIPTRALASVTEMGKTLVGRPQLYSTIAVDGGLAAYVVRQILLNNKPESGRYFIKFNDIFNIVDSDFSDSDERGTILSSLQKR